MGVVRRTCEADFAALLAMKSDRDDVKWSGFATAPDPVRFREWFVCALSDQDRVMFTGLLDGHVAGYVHFRRAGTAFEISTGVAAAYRGRSLAGVFRDSATKLFRQSLPDATIETWIAEDNIASQRSWTKMGFVPSATVRHQRLLFPEPHDTIMRLWVEG